MYENVNHILIFYDKLIIGIVEIIVVISCRFDYYIVRVKKSGGRLWEKKPFAMLSNG